MRSCQSVTCVSSRIIQYIGVYGQLAAHHAVVYVLVRYVVCSQSTAGQQFTCSPSTANVCFQGKNLLLRREKDDRTTEHGRYSMVQQYVVCCLRLKCK